MWSLRDWDEFGRPVCQDKVSCPIASFFLLLLAYQTLLLVIVGIYYYLDHGERAELSGQPGEPYRTSVSIRGGRGHWGRRPSRQ